MPARRRLARRERTLTEARVQLESAIAAFELAHDTCDAVVTLRAGGAADAAEVTPANLDGLSTIENKDPSA